MRTAVTGGAGFIGSNLARALVEGGHEVVVIDNFSTGHRKLLDDVSEHTNLSISECDVVLEPERLVELVRGSDVVVHLAANADVRFGLEHPYKDLEQNVIGTQHVLEAARLGGAREVVLSSTGSVYGEAEIIPTPEDAPFPQQTSLYGASKLAAEGYVAAYVEGYGLNATVYRFVSILGRDYSHGHVIDFVAQLVDHPDELHILGDGKQRKSYLEVGDCVHAIIGRLGKANGYEVFNLGVDAYCTVDESADWICERVGVKPRRTYAGGSRGWVGDNPFIFLDTTKIQATGWKPRFTIRQAVERTVDYLLENRWVLELRKPQHKPQQKP